MKRLVAYVQHDPSQSKPWRYVVETFSPESERFPGCCESRVECLDTHTLLIDAVRMAERAALQRGFGLTWHGFVAHGFEIEGERQTSSEPKGTEGGR